MCIDTALLKLKVPEGDKGSTGPSNLSASPVKTGFRPKCRQKISVPEAAGYAKLPGEAVELTQDNSPEKGR
jgi:hypothetical protein